MSIRIEAQQQMKKPPKPLKSAEELAKKLGFKSVDELKKVGETNPREIEERAKKYKVNLHEYEGPRPPKKNGPNSVIKERK